MDNNENHEQHDHNGEECPDCGKVHSDERNEAVMEIASLVRKAEKRRAVLVGLACEEYDEEVTPTASVHFVKEVLQAQERFNRDLQRATDKMIQASTGIDPRGLIEKIMRDPEIMERLDGLALNPAGEIVGFKDGEEVDLEEAGLILHEDPDPETTALGESIIPGIDLSTTFEPKRDFDGKVE